MDLIRGVYHPNSSKSARVHVSRRHLAKADTDQFAAAGCLLELLEGMEHAVLSIEPDSSPAFLHVLFDDAFLPARGHVAEVRIEQIVRAHHGKPGVDRAAFVFVDLVDSRFHVVVDAATWHATQRSKRTGMGIKQHLMALAGVSNQPECATGAQRHVGDLDTSKRATDQQTLGSWLQPRFLAHLDHASFRRHKIRVFAMDIK